MGSVVMPISQNLKDVQVFTPNPALTTKLTIPAGGNVVWTVPAGVSVFQFQPTCGVNVTYNSNADGLSYDANVRSDCLGRHPSTLEVKFTDTGAAGGTVTVEAM